MRRGAAMILERLRTVFTFERLFFLILVLTVFLRFYRLDLKLFHHDEAIHAWFSYRLLHDGVWSYDPSYHGPLLYYITAGMFWLLGDGDVVGRIVPALLGTLIVALIYPLYRMGYLDKRQTLVGALFLSISPDLVYFSRFLRQDIFMLFFIMLLLVTLLAYLETGSRWYGLGVAISVAGGMTLKEEFPAILLIFGIYFIYAGWKGRIKFPPKWKQDLAIFTAVALGIIALFYSSLGKYPEMIVNAGPLAIQHWIEMHEECRLCGPWFFYLILFALYELPILILAIVGTLQFLADHSDLRRRVEDLAGWFRRREHSAETLVGRLQAGGSEPASPLEAKRAEFFGFCIWWMVLTMAFYAYVNEKVPWLILPQLLPAIFVAVYRMTPLKTVIAVASVVFLVLCTWHTCFVPADVNEPIVQVQNSEDLRGLFAQIDNSTKVAVASENYWPLPWYYRGVLASKLSYYGKKVDEATIYNNNFDVVIAYDQASYDSLKGYAKRTIRLNYWFSYYDNQDRLLDWYFLRDGKVGSMNLDIFTRVRPSGSSSGK
ncbi:MAG TPA: flippase activity-associated protein Agl23 [Methanomicrobiales archaeon]|nr:flippase activity-associated protein Agl23 [Methanomicrobiales archaeon]